MSLSYSRLNPDNREIRLFRIWPDEEEGNPIQGSLHIVSLDDNHEFEALSYTWGDSATQENISIDGCTVGVLTNLNLFLHALRQPAQERTVWVDYICINQDDLEEKSTQIPFMSQIYTTTTSVIAWLGEMNPNIEDAVAYGNFSCGGRDLHRPYWHNVRDHNELSTLECYEETYAMMSVYEGTLDIIYSPYWQRLWTFQEWNLPSRQPVCMCGTLAFTAENVFHQASIWSMKFSVLSSKVRPTMQRETHHTAATYIDGSEYAGELEYFEKLEYFDGMLRRNDMIRKKFPSISHMQNFYMYNDQFRLGPGKPKFPISMLLCDTMLRKCSNPLDRVYALYAMCHLVQEKYPPDYQKTINQVNHETSAYALQHERYMEIFRCFKFSTDDSLPSWVLDITAMDVRRWGGPRTDSIAERDPAKKTNVHSPTVTDDLKSLHLWVRTLGFIRGSILLCSDTSTAITRAQDILYSMGRDKKMGSTLTHSFVSALWHSSESIGSFSFHSFAKILKTDLREGNQSGEIADKHPAEFLCDWPKLDRKCFFYVFTGPESDSAPVTVGFTTCKAEDGDMLFIPAGITLVLVLRPLKEEGSLGKKGAPYFKIVGKAFLGGIAESEILTFPNPLDKMIEEKPWMQVSII
ncbi:HET-domain-containing protein [Aspergillus ellipticus CBS 707.79]|uniref:HET-domain-containing protein n=1 Tax=Aspergillus ellipticus CBS 707.79 TaxID=1448320 RepID=A0A319DGC1_9EURO|nr:HET-domain-containing protein [Aspergillus ellipticus CBS 707.79]